MFKGYKFGNISKSVYSKVTGANNDNKNESTPVESNVKQETKQNENNTNPQKGYQFGDITKSVYNKWHTSEYQFGDLTKGAFHSITGRFEPFKVTITNPIKEGFLQKRLPLLLTYRKYWVVLQETFLYLFKDKQQYNQCVEIIDLSSYNSIGSISNTVRYSFEVISGKNAQRFVASSHTEMKEWIKCIMKTIGVQILEEMKESVISKKEDQDQVAFDLECVAYYIIDLEYNHSETGNPQSLLSNQNFIISTIIWCYMHEEDKQFNKKLFLNLDDDQRSALKYWQQPMAVAHGIRGGLKGAKQGPVHGAGGGLFAGVMMFAAHNGPPPIALPVLLPLSIVAGTAYGVGYLAPTYFANGFKDSYDSVQ